jgi:vanillate O-demethylase ferredoxin subunit
LTGQLLHLRVRRVRREAAEVVSVAMAAEDGSALPAFAPGAHLRFHLPSGIVRQYSLCGDCTETSAYEVAVKLEPASRGGSTAMHALREGDRVAVFGPWNNFEVDWSAAHSVFIAGGIGITPLLAMWREAHRRDASCELHYFARSPEHAAFLSQFEGIGRVFLHFGLDASAVRPKLDQIFSGCAKNATAYLCGPQPLMDTARTAAAGFGLQVRSESFGAASAPVSLAGDTFTVRLAKSGVELPVPKGKSILDVIERAGIEADSSCREGVCGICFASVLEGVPDHRDEFLSEDARKEGKSIALCVSRSLSPVLVLDL